MQIRNRKLLNTRAMDSRLIPVILHSSSQLYSDVCTYSYMHIQSVRIRLEIALGSFLPLSFSQALRYKVAGRDSDDGKEDDGNAGRFKGGRDVIEEKAVHQ